MDQPPESVEDTAVTCSSLLPLEVTMNRKAAVITVMLFTSLMATQVAFPWGSLTHAYITNQIVTQDSPLRGDAIYGSTAPDFPNYMLTSPYMNYLMDCTHVDFMRVWNMARGGPGFGPERAAAFGFVAHNEEDFTAHTMSQYLGDHTQGYVIQKAAVLEGMLAQAGIWQQLDLDGDEYAELRDMLCHLAIEYAGDIYIASMDPQTGQILSSAAAGNNGTLSEVIAKAYAGGLVAASNRMAIPLNQPAASTILAEGEFGFRGVMMYYGYLCTGPESQVIVNISQFVAQLANTIGIQVSDAQVGGILMAGLFVIAPDFASEISATREFVEGKLAHEKVVPY
jgi:hypothetical protein